MRMSDRQEALLVGSGVITLIGLLSIIPFVGVLLGPLFKTVAGFVGGCVVAFLVASSGRSGARRGAVVGFAGGIVSAIVNWFANIALAGFISSADGEAASAAAGAALLGLVGAFTSWIFVVVGAVVGGGVVGWMFGDVRTEEQVEM